MRGRNMWISRQEGETAVVKMNGEAGRRAQTRIEITNKTEITETKITVKTTQISTSIITERKQALNESQAPSKL